ncbi:MAG: hypothetical protein ACK55Z_22170, partial [bacterium]
MSRSTAAPVSLRPPSSTARPGPRGMMLLNTLRAGEVSPGIDTSCAMTAMLSGADWATTITNGSTSPPPGVGSWEEIHAAYLPLSS